MSRRLEKAKKSRKSHHILNFNALPDGPLEHSHEGEGVGEYQAKLTSIQSYMKKKED